MTRPGGERGSPGVRPTFYPAHGPFDTPPQTSRKLNRQYGKQTGSGFGGGSSGGRTGQQEGESSSPGNPASLPVTLKAPWWPGFLYVAEGATDDFQFGLAAALTCVDIHYVADRAGARQIGVIRLTHDGATVDTFDPDGTDVDGDVSVSFTAFIDGDGVLTLRCTDDDGADGMVVVSLLWTRFGMSAVFATGEYVITRGANRQTGRWAVGQNGTAAFSAQEYEGDDVGIELGASISSGELTVTATDTAQGDPDAAITLSCRMLGPKGWRFPGNIGLAVPETTAPDPVASDVATVIADDEGELDWTEGQFTIESRLSGTFSFPSNLEYVMGDWVAVRGTKYGAGHFTAYRDGAGVGPLQFEQTLELEDPPGSGIFPYDPSIVGSDVPNPPAIALVGNSLELTLSDNSDDSTTSTQVYLFFLGQWIPEVD